MKKSATKKRNATDATLRNINALKKRMKMLEDDIRVLWTAHQVVAVELQKVSKAKRK